MSARDVHRNFGFDLLRVFAMLSIVACHATLHIPWLLHVDTGLDYLPGWKSALMYLVVQYGQVGVSIFFMISGYFLVKRTFSWRRIVRTWLQMFLYSVISLIVMLPLMHVVAVPSSVSGMFSGDQFWRMLLVALFPFLSSSYWFVTAYIVMLLFTPFVNCLFEHLPKRSIEALILLLGFFGVWVLWGNQTGIAPVFWNNVAYAVTGYLIGGWIRLYHSENPDRMKPLPLIAGILISSAVMLVFNHYAADRTRLGVFLGWDTQIKPGIVVLPMVIAAAILMLVLNIDTTNVPSGIRGLTVRLSSAMFGVYLIHENQFWYKIIWPITAIVVPGPASSLWKVLAAGMIIVVVFALLTMLSWIIETVLVNPATKLTMRILPKKNS
ncbi:acyltransferase [Bifidobacterium rousetti]|uniref:acyltransferase n=1 Tax=Bifidobacterium rousetti TaxID=2045439 RepID=UPI00168BC2FC|nr:acyltransferase [Bifidobacterium rousetti]